MSSAVKCFCWLILAAAIMFASGCATEDPQNASVRPWNAPQSWEGGLPVDMGQHR
jgi:hypothetical protein